MVEHPLPLSLPPPEILFPRCCFSKPRNWRKLFGCRLANFKILLNLVSEREQHKNMKWQKMFGVGKKSCFSHFSLFSLFGQVLITQDFPFFHSPAHGGKEGDAHPQSSKCRRGDFVFTSEATGVAGDVRIGGPFCYIFYIFVAWMIFHCPYPGNGLN